MCVLCRDTFSRSDILKRHFIKCSVRRGNPTGASHLSHPQAHVKKNAAAQQKAMGTDGDVNHINGMGNMPTDIHPFGLIPANDGMNNIPNDQSQLSRSSSINRLDDSNRDRRSMTGSVMGASTRGGSFDQTYNNGEVANNMTANINPQLANYSMPSNSNGMPMFAGSGSTDWSQMFQAGAQNHTSVHNFPPNNGQTQTVPKHEPNAEPARAVGIPGSDPADPTLPTWGISYISPDPYQQLSDKIISFMYPKGTVMSSATTGVLNHYFQPDNIRHFLDNYTHFHTHFSILHIPTFRVMDAYVGLVAGMCCIGACYSDLVPPANVREVMNALKRALEASSRMFASLSQGFRSDNGYNFDNFGRSNTDVEELQAIMLTLSLFLWHGTPVQRETARQTFPLVASLARNAGLLQVSQSTPLYSHAHQPGISAQQISASNFDWVSWIEQEKRVRIMYLIFLCDVALGLYFNTGPQFDALDIRLPLPADDAAWEATNQNECAEALGLYGPDLAKLRNPDGTRRCNQPEMHLVLKALLHNSYQIQPGATNLLGKFVLIHALLAMIRRVQLDGSAAAIASGSSTPIPQDAWFLGGTLGHVSASSSGRTTPVEAGANLLDRQTFKTLWTALDKFKANWDNDMATQFPPGVATHPRRYGFSKDGIHYYWLATYLLKNTRSADLQMSPDLRFTFIMRLLRTVRDWVMKDGASRGEELGSIGDVDGDYGVKDLTLDMTQLFRPLSRAV